MFPSRGQEWALGYNEFDFFLENEEYRPFDGCKIEIQDTFTHFWFFEPFFACLASKFSKNANMTPKKFFEQNPKISPWFRILWKSLKKCTNFDCTCAGNGSKKRKSFFMNVSLNFIRQPSNSKGVQCMTKLLKSLYPTGHTIYGASKAKGAGFREGAV